MRHPSPPRTAFRSPRIPNAVALLACLLGLALLVPAGHAQPTAPAVLPRPVPAALASPVPSFSILHAISSDGRWLLLTHSGDRATTNDLNASADVFLLDRQAGRLTLVSAGSDGHSFPGTSLAAGFSVDATRIAFQTRAAGLLPGGSNLTWNVLVRDVATASNLLASVAFYGGAPAGPATEPQLSADGHFVLFSSPARNLTLGSLAFLGPNVFRRDLTRGTTAAVTTALPGSLGTPNRLLSWVGTSDGTGVALELECRIANISRREIAFQNLTTHSNVHVSQYPPSELGPGTLLHSAPAVSGNGRYVAFRSDTASSIFTRHALSVHDLLTRTTTLLSLRTNTTARQTFPADAYRAALSTDGRFVVYTAPSRPDPAAPIPTNGPSQVYCLDGVLETITLVSAAPDGVSPADAGASQPRLAADGRGVLFVSEAANLVDGLTNYSPRLLWWDRVSAAVRLVTPLEDAAIEGRVVMDPEGAQVAWLDVDPDGVTVVHVYQTADAAVTVTRLEPVRIESVTSPGWTRVQPAGVSADGRFVALTDLPLQSPGGTNHYQVQLVDTRSGTRQVISQAPDGLPGNGHPAPPCLSADATSVLFVSAASNLVPGDDPAPDAFVVAVDTGEWRRLQSATLPASAPALDDCLLSPDGGVAWLRFNETVTSTRARSFLAGTASGVVSAAFPGTTFGAASFSRDGGRLAVTHGPSTTAAQAAIEVHDSQAWITGNGLPQTALWTSAIPAREPVLSADGQRVAFVQTVNAALGTNAIVVVDWSRNQVLFSHPAQRTTASMPALSQDGKVVAWLAPDTLLGPVNHVWCADVATGEVTRVTLSPDGALANGNSRFVALSANGRYVAFASLANNLVPGDNNGAKDVFLHDRTSGQTLLVSRSPGGEPGSGWSLQPFFSADGRTLFFLSQAGNLAPGDDNENLDLYRIEILDQAGPLLAIQRNLATGEAQLLWTAVAGQRHAVEYQDDLGAAWIRLPGEFTGSAPVTLDPTPGMRRFFRLKELQ